MSAVSPPRRIRRSGDRFIPVRDQDSALGLDSTQLRFNLHDATESVYDASSLRVRGDASQGVSADTEERSVGEASPSRVPSSASPMRQRMLLMAARTRYSESGELLDGSFRSSMMEPEASVTTTAERVLENARLDWSDVFGPGSSNAVLRVPRVEDSVAVATPPRARTGAPVRTNHSSSDSSPVGPETRWASGADSHTSAAAAASAGVRSDLEALLATLSPEGRAEATESSFDVGARDHATISSRHGRPHARRHEALLRLLDRMDREQRDQWNSGSAALQAVTQQVQALLQAAALVGDGADDESVVEIAMELFADPQGIAAALPMTNDASLMARAIVASPSRRPVGYNTIARTPGRVNPGTLTDGASYPELQGVITAPETRLGIRSTSANTNAVLALSAHLPPHAQHATVESTARAASEAAYMAQIGGLGGTGAATSMLASSLTGAARTMVSGSAPPSTYAIILENELLH
ncbi:hypothetical protein F1559_003655 [Cyanidiococcus yangmingshanensis]|uniref:Uncharacterized protein n=1 Tax=Cyanidiococcus yangmingshanensis TaxID=2690220 RepID=A0A7J7IP39_9RHOD|nr:hypothetical protein F1559_003655 [Cyanidiococcus yangmingshanensis]